MPCEIPRILRVFDAMIGKAAFTRLLEYDRAVALPGQSESGGEPADTASGDEERQRVPGHLAPSGLVRGVVPTMRT